MKELTMKITEKAVQACVVPEGQRFVTICDAVQEGLVVRKTRAGDMDYLVRYYDAAGIGYEAPMAAVGDISGNATYIIRYRNEEGLERQQTKL